MAIEQAITERNTDASPSMGTLRYNFDLSGFNHISAIIPKEATLEDLISDSARHMACAIEILRSATADLERADPRLASVLAGATILFMQADDMREAVHDAIIGRFAASV